MDNAIHELQQGHNGGVLVWFNEILYRGASADSSGEIEDAGSVAINCIREASFPAIANTIVFNYSHAQAWFFESMHKSTLLVRKRKRQFMTANDIMGTFTAGAEARAHRRHHHQDSGSSNNAGSSGDAVSSPGRRDRKKNQEVEDMLENAIIAQLVTRNLGSPQQQNGGGSGGPLITYYTRRDLERLLHHETISEASLLQEFIPPHGADGGSGSFQNYCFVAHWQPSYCYVEKYINSFAVDDWTKSAQVRGATVDSTKWTDNTTVKGHAAQAKVTQCCNAMARHVYAVTGFHLRSMEAAFKVNADDRLALLYVQSVSLAENPRPSTGLSGNHRVSIRRPSSSNAVLSSGAGDPGRAGGHADDGDDDNDESAWLAMERKGRRREGRSAETLRALKQREREADAKFSQIAPKSWDIDRARRRREQAAARIAEQMKLEAEAKKLRRMPSSRSSASLNRSPSRTSRSESYFPNSVTYNTAPNLLQRSPLLSSTPSFSQFAFNNNSTESNSGGWHFQSGGTPSKEEAPIEVSRSRANSMAFPASPSGTFSATTPPTVSFSDDPFSSAEQFQGAEAIAASTTATGPRRQSMTVKQFEELRVAQSEKRRTKLRISNLTWGVPSKLDTALLRKPNGGPFSVDYLASNVAAMGLREKYLRCMNCNNIAKEALLAKGQQQQMS